MKNDLMVPAAIRYSKARLRPLISPGFWVSTAILLLGVLVVWEAWKNPDGMTSLLQNSESEDVEQELSADDELDISPPSGLSAAERAIAEVDELEKLIKELDINITATPNKPQSKSRASSRQKPSGASSLTLDPQFQDQLVSTDELTYPGVAEGTTDALKLPTPPTTGFYNPEMSLDTAKQKDRNLPVHPLKSALERRLSTTNSTGRSQTQVLPKPEVRPDELRPSAYGVIIPSQSPSEQFRPNAYGTNLSRNSPSTSDQFRPSAYGAIAPKVLPSPSAVGRPEIPAPSTYTPVPINSYNYVMQTPPGGGPAVPYLIAPVGRPGLIPQPGLPNPNPGVANNLYNRPQQLYNQPQQQPDATPAPFSNSTSRPTNPIDGGRLDEILNP